MSIELTKRAKKDLKKPDAVTRERILLTLYKFEMHQENIDFSKLSDSSDKWRIRVGRWRVVLDKNAKSGKWQVLYIKLRPKAYK
ncbi:MAG: hypothetical protein K8T10_01180 [Candidatus Eremiobacteraeota bacterium]|nr:hypothetical protein [Candidatus Eremiobacteraeota bacterium]